MRSLATCVGGARTAPIAAGDPRIQLTDPSGVPNQPWDCAATTGTKGASLFTESVALGTPLSIGTSKRGNPITGGNVTGRLTGAVASGGGDYQLLGTNTELDARYFLAPTATRT